MKNVLVTGGAGYIGSHTCKALARAGYAPVAFDNLSTGYRRNVRWGPLIEADILDPAALARAFTEFTPLAVIHFAARAYVAESVSDPAIYYATNVLGTLNVANAARHAGRTPLIFSSSCASYGIPDHVPVTEDTAQEPVNPYGRTKLAGEQILADFRAAYGLPSLWLRYFNAAGADPDGETGENPAENTRIIPNAVRALLTGIPFQVMGDDYATPDGTAVRDYVHVSDLASAHVAALDYLLRGGTQAAFNIGTGHGLSVRQILDGLAEVAGRPVPVTIAPRRPGDPPALVADPSRARALLAFEPGHSSVRSILSTAFSWHESHPA